MTDSSNEGITPSSQETISESDAHQYLGQMPQLEAHGMLSTALSAAVPLWVFEIYERGGPTDDDWRQLPKLSHLLTERGDVLLYGSSRKGETANLFNRLAEGLAILSFLPSGIPFGGQRYDALQILTGFLGPERAQRYLAQVPRTNVP